MRFVKLILILFQDNLTNSLYFSNDIQLINRISDSGAIIPGFWLRL